MSLKRLGIYRCPYCGKYFSSREALVKHLDKECLRKPMTTKWI